MRALLQRVKSASVSVQGTSIAAIGAGLAVLVGVRAGDGLAEADYLAEKTAHLRIFEDEGGKINLSLLATGGEALIVSQFTLYADAGKGRRPSFTEAAPPEHARALVERYTLQLRALGVPTQSGEFGAHMLVEIHNDGPVTILLEK